MKKLLPKVDVVMISYHITTAVNMQSLIKQGFILSVQHPKVKVPLNPSVGI